MIMKEKVRLINPREGGRVLFKRLFSLWRPFFLSSLPFILALLYWYFNQQHDQISTLNKHLPKPLLGSPTASKPTKFQLKHIYHHNTKVNFEKHGKLDITDSFIRANDLQIADYEEGDWSSKYRAVSPWEVKLPFSTSKITLRRLVNRNPDFVESYLEYARVHGSPAVEKIELDWSDDDVDAPNITDKETVISLALMSSNAYVRIPETGDWRDVFWNHTLSHGWNGTGVRGHIFVSDDNSTVVIAYKGTSAKYLSGSGEDDTVPEDRDNDNLLFSCCCGRVSYMWTPVCDCYESSYTCNERCLEKELYRKDKYYQAALDVYRNVSSLYPNANVWTTGHSLGGSLASLVGRTFGLPAVAFEAPGELLATKRLHLPMPPGLPSFSEGIWHFGHTADPIFMGVCNGASSACSAGGYALETQCHSGKQCVYDVVTDKGWHVSLLNHRIHLVIDDVLDAYNETAPCIDVPPCHDCFNWNFSVDGDDDTDNGGKKSTTILSSTVSSPTPTDSPECKKRTWYGRCIEYEP